MARKNYTPEQIIKHLREAEIFLGKGGAIGQACKKLGISEQTYYRWRREYGGMPVVQAKMRKSTFIRLLTFMICLCILTVIGIYSLNYPPSSEISLKGWRQVRSKASAQPFQHSFLEVIEVTNNGSVLLKGVNKSTELCTLPPSSSDSWIPVEGSRINAFLTIEDGKCVIVNAVTGSGHRKAKLIISGLAVLIVAFLLIRDFQINPREAQIVKRKSNA